MARKPRNRRNAVQMSLVRKYFKMHYSEREIAAALEDEGLKISRSTVNRYLKTTRETTPGGKPRFNKKLDGYARLNAIRIVLTKKAQTTRGVHALLTQMGYTASRRTVCRLLKSCPQLAFKKPKKKPSITKKKDEEVGVGEGSRFRLGKHLFCRREVVGFGWASKQGGLMGRKT
jgi:transposase